MKLIKVGQKHFAKVDDEDYEFLSGFNWQAHKAKRSKTIYARFSRSIDGTRTPTYMHRVIMKCAKGGQLIDHADMDGLNSPCIFSQKKINC